VIFPRLVKNQLLRPLFGSKLVHGVPAPNEAPGRRKFRPIRDSVRNESTTIMNLGKALTFTSDDRILKNKLITGIIEVKLYGRLAAKMRK